MVGKPSEKLTHIFLQLWVSIHFNSPLFGCQMYIWVPTMYQVQFGPWGSMDEQDRPSASPLELIFCEKHITKWPHMLNYFNGQCPSSSFLTCWLLVIFSVPMAVWESVVPSPLCLSASVSPASTTSKGLVSFEDTNSSGELSSGPHISRCATHIQPSRHWELPSIFSCITYNNHSWYR